jgi:hypothetical protein
MQRLSVWARRIALGFFTLFILPLVGKVLDHMAENYGLYDREALPQIINAFVSLAEQTWLRITVLVLAGFVAGLWLDWLLRRLDRSRAEARENLGIEMTNLANDIDNALALVDRFRLPDFSPRLISAFIKAKQVGLWTPDVGMPLNVVMDYLRHVGTLLSDGHFADAKQAALERKQAFSRSTKREQSSPAH